jgi:lactate dehydrogenase-like 2-hydroxyacid dehydrogenase
MSLPTVLVLRPIAEAVIDGLRGRADIIELWRYDDPDAVLAAQGGDVRAIAVSQHAPVDGTLMDRLPQLELVANFGVGYDSVDAAEAARRSIVVTNTPDVLNDDVADTALALLLMAARQLPAAERYLRSGGWTQAPFPLTPTTVAGRTLGILGLGRIGEAVARRALAVGVNVVYHNRRPKPGAPYPYYSSLLEMARDVDTLLVTIPGGPATRNVVDASVLAALGERGILINVGRGSVVDEAALEEALASGTILSAGLDVYADEPAVPQGLLDMDHVVLLPHVGSATQPTRDAMAALVVENVLSWFEQGTAVTPVPETTAG